MKGLWDNGNGNTGDFRGFLPDVTGLHHNHRSGLAHIAHEDFWRLARWSWLSETRRTAAKVALHVFVVENRPTRAGNAA